MIFETEVPYKDEMAEIFAVVEYDYEYEEVFLNEIRFIYVNDEQIKNISKEDLEILENETIKNIFTEGEDLAEKIMHYDRNADAEYKAHMFLMNRIQDRTIL